MALFQNRWTTLKSIVLLAVAVFLYVAPLPEWLADPLRRFPEAWRIVIKLVAYLAVLWGVKVLLDHSEDGRLSLD